eukprot:6203376-Pleurochrysis_carterae.AAC.1
MGSCTGFRSRQTGLSKCTARSGVCNRSTASRSKSLSEAYGIDRWHQSSPGHHCLAQHLHTFSAIMTCVSVCDLLDQSAERAMSVQRSR